jgi:uncharacterized membrane protein
MNARVEAFSDGVFAIAITVLILDIKVPPLESIRSVADVWRDIGSLWPSFFALCLSFTIILISWVGHHSLLRTLDKTSAKFQFANGFFLFTVIFIPFPTAFMAEYLNTPFAQPAIVFYCAASFLHNIGWNVLHRYILKPIPLMKSSTSLARVKEIARGAKYGLFIYSAIAVLAWWFPYVAIVLSLLLWIYWLYLSTAFKHEDA